MDQVVVRAEPQNKTTMTIYADPKARGYHDLLVKGGQFYAVYDPASQFWKKGLGDLSRLIDGDIEAFARAFEAPDGIERVVPKFMNSMANGAWNRYLTQLKGLEDSKVQLDQTIYFANDDIKREDYASFREPYELRESPIDNYDKLMSTIYSPEQRQKLEWGIGLLVDGKKVKRTHKFFVICGDPGTGKSTVLDIIQQLFQGYIAYFNAQDLGKGYTFATAAFKDAPLIAIQTDGDLSHLYDNTAINQISGHETIVVNEKGVKQYPVNLKTMMFMATNKPVRITDAQSGLIRRLIDIYPTGKTLPNAEYFECMDNIQYELGGIAWHCLQVYRSMGANAYGSYVATEMIARTNDIYSFLSSQLDMFEGEEEVDAGSLWRDFKGWCEDSNIDVRMKRDEFIYEVGNYFETVRRRMVNGRPSTRNVTFARFKWHKFEQERTPKKETVIAQEPQLVLDQTVSNFDKIAENYPGQYAADTDIGQPRTSWDQCTTTLKELDTTKLHWVKVPENHIVLDFDLKGPDGEKDQVANLQAASAYPPTYAEFSKSGNGVHLHYIYDGDVTQLKPLIDVNIECKVYRGKAALRRQLSYCNNLPIAHISSGLPLKEKKAMMDNHAIENEEHLRALVKGNLRKRYVGGTKPSIDFIATILEEANEQDVHYNITDLRPAVLAFAMASKKNKNYCIKVVANMKFKYVGDEILEPVHPTDTSVLTFYDVEVFPNLFMICFKDTDKDYIQTWINPSAKSVRELANKNLVGFNNRKYDNHILYAWGWLDYDNVGLYHLSQDIVSGRSGVLFPNAFNMSYTDIYDYSSKKQGLKKWEIQLGIDHHELGMPWDQPVPEDKWPLVQSYCEDDVRATEKVFEATHEDFVARLGLANLSGLTPNDTSNTHSVKIIFGDDPNPQREFNFVDLSKTFPGYTFNPFKPGKEKSMYLGEPPSEGGYVWVYGMDSGDVGRYWESKHVFQKTSHERLDEMRHMYRVCLNQDYDEVHPELVKQYQQMNPLPVNPNYTWPVVDEEHKIVGGMFGNVGLFDVASLHPSSLEAMQFFGPKYTKRFSEIKSARIDIKHKNLESAKKRMNGAFADLIKDGEDTKGLAGALKIVINSVYGLTSASFPTKCNDVASGVNDRNKDNKVAKRGALFMILLKQMVLELGYTAVHVKTDSIKVADADIFITAFINDMGKHYGYDFEHEATYDRMCIVNRSTYIAYEAYGDDKGKWTPTGTQFLQPYVLKTLFRKEALEFKDLAETKQVKTCIYLDFNEDLPEGEHHYDFVGKISAFTPVKPGCGGGLLMREAGEDSYAAVTGTKGYRWKESSVLRALGKEDQVDMRYYEAEAQDAIEAIRSYGDYDWFIDIASPYISPSKESNDYLQYLLEA